MTAGKRMDRWVWLRGILLVLLLPALVAAQGARCLHLVQTVETLAAQCGHGCHGHEKASAVPCSLSEHASEADLYVRTSVAADDLPALPAVTSWNCGVAPLQTRWVSAVPCCRPSVCVSFPLRC